MSLADVRIVMFHGRPENLNLTHSIKFITIKFLKNIVLAYKEEAKTTEFIQCRSSFWETS